MATTRGICGGNFGGAVMRVISETDTMNDYAIYGSFWVLLPGDDPVRPPSQPAVPRYDQAQRLRRFPSQFSASSRSGPGSASSSPRGCTRVTSSKSGPYLTPATLGRRWTAGVEATITSPSGVTRTRSWYANKIGWLYPIATSDFLADEPVSGRWTCLWSTTGPILAMG